MIKVQTNTYPSHCIYSAIKDSSNVAIKPASKDISFTVKFNPGKDTTASGTQ